MSERQAIMWHSGRLSTEEAGLFAELLNSIPPDVGWSVSRSVTPPGAPTIIGYGAVVLLPGACQEQAAAIGDTPYQAMMKAMAEAHRKAAHLFERHADRKAELPRDEQAGREWWERGAR